jgi:hypothetical protein
MRTKQSVKTLAMLAAGLLLPVLSHAAEDDAHKLELKLRGVHFDREFDDSANDRAQTALGLQLNYESPYFGDVIGFAMSGYSINRLGSSGRVVTDILEADGSGGFHDSSGKVAQAFIKLKHGDLLDLKFGRQLHDSLLLSSSTSRAVPNTFSGGSGVIEPMSGLQVYGAIYDRWSRRAESGFEKFATDRSARGDLDYVAVAGAEYKSGPFALNLEYLESKDFLRKLGVVGAYTFALADKDKLTLSGGIHNSRDAGQLFVTSSENGELDDEDKYAAGTRSDNDGTGVYVDVDWRVGNVALGAAVAQFDGAWIEDNFAGDHGTNPFPTGGVLADMTNNDETVWMVRAGYNWKDYVKGLNTTVKFKRGTGARNSHVAQLGEADEEELELDLRYQIPLLKGLNFRYRYLHYTSDKSGRVDGVLADNTDHRVYLDYTYRFF